MTKLFRIEHKTFKNGPYRIIETDIPIDTLNRCKLKRVSENVTQYLANILLVHLMSLDEL